MPQSLASVYVHLVFSTKYRQPLITDKIKEDLFAYIGGICAQLDCHPLKVGGYRDHVHIGCALSKKLALIKLLEAVKGTSSRWVKQRFEGCDKFYWQDGYAAFSVSPANIHPLIQYIDSQEAHHQKITFQEECRKFFTTYQVAYDERYVWD